MALAGDYAFTGSGLGSAMMVYSTYAMILHVGFISHAHNLFLQIALEQGLPGPAGLPGAVGRGLGAACASRLPERLRDEPPGGRFCPGAWPPPRR